VKGLGLVIWRLNKVTRVAILTPLMMLTRIAKNSLALKARRIKVKSFMNNYPSRKNAPARKALGRQLR
jgi:hypothetical protein